MIRIQDKVKDIVEVRPYKGLREFSADAQTTLESYCFTDDTSALMAKWLDTVSNLSVHSGTALALAGYRGVGKSHFLATFGSIVSLPELRSKISNSYVSAAAQGLLRRHYRLVSVRRGSQETFIGELRDGIEETYGSDIDFGDDEPESILQAALSRAGDLPLIIIIDTALERGSRVERNDGDVLARVAEFAKAAHVLVCVALDDDIAGADGSNSAIVRTYGIDFLDQEHLYKVVNSYIFPKYGAKEPVINEIYNYFCKVVPNFRWSAQRFSSLYPLHPGIVELAPFLRLYVHDFALLSFAAEAGERILGRPANSLIAFDEVFDNAEPELRKIDDLADAFAAYDRLNAEVVGKVPVIQRLQAKLILKALLLLSLNGQGATAADICASMLIFDENDPPKALATARGIIEMFSAALPNDITSTAGGAGDAYYSFRVSAKEDVNSALQDAVSKIDPAVASTVIRSLLQERFSDLVFDESSAEGGRNSSECTALWRGGQRRGRVQWLASGEAYELPTVSADRDFLDWEAIIVVNGTDVVLEADPEVSRVVWRADVLRPEEVETLLRHHLLQTDSGLFEQFGEHLQASIHAHRVAVEKIVERIMLTNGQLIIDGFDYNFTEKALSASTVSGIFSQMLEPLFETRFPLHPHFTEPLGMAEVSKLVTELYDSSRQRDDDVQALARTFALPLALVKFEAGIYVPESVEILERIPYVSDVLKMVADSFGNAANTSLKAVYASLRQPPYGLVREAQHLVLASLVANRKIEFVTSLGDRINARSLDLHIIWDDIVGIAKPIETGVSAKRLVKWAQVITADVSIKNLEDAKHREKIIEAGRVWLTEWDNSNVLSRFDELPDGLISTGYWANAVRVRKTFGDVADAFRALLATGDTNNALEEALARVADIFLDSEDEFKRSSVVTKAVEDQLVSINLQQEILSYLAATASTDDTDLEQLRTALINSLRHATVDEREVGSRETGYLWEQFHKSYSELFVMRHDHVMRSHDLQEKFDQLRKTDIWWEFDFLSSLPILSIDNRRKVESLNRKLNELDCQFDVAEALISRPECLCGFRLSEYDAWMELPADLSTEISRGQKAIRSRLRSIVPDLAENFRRFAENSANPVEANAALSLLEALTGSEDDPRFSQMELDVLYSILNEAPPPVIRHGKNEAINDNSSDMDGSVDFLQNPNRKIEEPALVEM